MPGNTFSAREARVLRTLNTPVKIQRFIDIDIRYNKEKDGETVRSPRRALRDRTAHCLEGALLAAAALNFHGHPPLVWDLEATRDDDHVLAIFRERGHWGAIAKSNYSGLRFREPVYRNLRELAMSYFEHYYNLRGEKTLRGFSRPVNLDRFDGLHWKIAEEDLWQIPSYLCTVRHTPLLTRESERNLNRMDQRLFDAGRLGALD